MSHGPSQDWSPDRVTDWILSTGRFLPSLRDLVEEVGARLALSGAPVWRVRIALRTLHPLVTALSTAWERDSGIVSFDEAPHGLETRDSFVGSPMDIISTTEQAFRRQLDRLQESDHLVLHELRERGATDYLGLPLRYSDGGGGIMVFVTQNGCGFSDNDLEKFARVADVIAPIVEIFRLKHLSDAVSAAYLGPRTAERVLAGNITLGHIDKIRAAIMVSDLRGWTAMNAELPPEESLSRVNRYFDLMDVAIAGQGGEILKFLGDGILAIFTDADTDGGTEACNAAHAAALSALDAVDEQALGWDMQFGIALHYGEVLYGNVGSVGRLDFTVMGQAVNIASRLEPLSAEYNQTIICSEQFAARVDALARPLGNENIKGLAAPQQIFAL
ncbi:MAG: adenylate/guanylate cyclase domain-containing protein [Arenibacterium sp.]